MKASFPSAYTVLLIISALVAIATWVMPAGYYKYQAEDGTLATLTADEGAPVPGTYSVGEKMPQGPFAYLQAPVKGFYDAQDIIVFVLILGGFINIALASGAINNGIFSMVKALEGRERLMIPILMCIFSLGGTIYGMGEETVGFYPVVIPIMLAAGYDTLTAAATILLGAGVGVMASTINPFATGVASGIAGIAITNGIILRVILLIACTALCIAYVMRYAAKVKKNPQASLVYDNYADAKKRFLGAASAAGGALTGRQGAVLAVFLGAFAVMIYGVIPISDVFGADTWLPELGFWFTEISAVFFAAAVIMGIIAGMSEKELVQNFMDGVKDIASVAIIIGVARGIKILMTDGAISGTMLYWAEELISSLSSYAFIAGAYVVEILLSFLIPSSSGLATFSVPILAPLASFANVEANLIVTAFATANGLVNLITPTSAILMAGLTIAKIPYERWIIFVVPLLLILAATTILGLVLGVMVS